MPLGNPPAEQEDVGALRVAGEEERTAVVGVLDVVSERGGRVVRRYAGADLVLGGERRAQHGQRVRLPVVRGVHVRHRVERCRLLRKRRLGPGEHPQIVDRRDHGLARAGLDVRGWIEIETSTFFFGEGGRARQLLACA